MARESQQNTCVCVSKVDGPHTLTEPGRRQGSHVCVPEVSWILYTSPMVRKSGERVEYLMEQGTDQMVGNERSYSMLESGRLVTGKDK